jgi:hydroxymethylpyrimidine pyrophosphatase-like HAD family hydrolase
MCGPKEKEIAEKTLSVLPSITQSMFIETYENNINGMIELFYKVFELTYRAGMANSLDPGRPHVAEFGRKLYHISYNPLSSRKRKPTIMDVAIGRKTDTKSSLYTAYTNAFQKFIMSLTQTEFNSIIFDFDGTVTDNNKSIDKDIVPFIERLLDNGIRIGFATGRGKSIRENLRERILSEHYWSEIIIGYYNGGDIDLLCSEPPNINIETYPSLTVLYEELVALLGTDEGFDLRPKQLSYVFNSSCNEIIELILMACSKHIDLKVMRSGHSIDIIPVSSSKCSVLKMLGSEDSVLTIGDAGQLGGNDFELLSCKYSLSVKNVSKSMESCWNIAPQGIENTAATLYYLKSIIYNRHGSFQLEFTDR